MPVTQMFSKRGKPLPDLYVYDKLPEGLRVQIVHIWRSAIGPMFREDNVFGTPESNQHWNWIHDTMAREKGVFYLGKESEIPIAQCREYLFKSGVADALDLIELTFRVIDGAVRRQGEYANERCQVSQDPDDAIEELNHRFREHGVGYQFAGGQLIKIDSQYVHTEVVRPALQLLNGEAFRGASEEFLGAHEHYRKGRDKEAIADALKSFESTMKTICDKRKWSYPAGATAKPLLDVLFANGLIPPEMQSHFSGVRATLEAGLPTVRNRYGGHGQGEHPHSVPSYIAAYALHLAAANIVLLVEAYTATK